MRSRTDFRNHRQTHNHHHHHHHLTSHPAVVHTEAARHPVGKQWPQSTLSFWSQLRSTMACFVHGALDKGLPLLVFFFLAQHFVCERFTALNPKKSDEVGTSHQGGQWQMPAWGCLLEGCPFVSWLAHSHCACGFVPTLMLKEMAVATVSNADPVPRSRVLGRVEQFPCWKRC